MKIIVHSDSILNSSELVQDQYRIILEALKKDKNNEVYILLPFSDGQVIYTNYEQLLSRNITLPEYFKNTNFILYKDLDISLINSIIIKTGINLFLSIFSILPIAMKPIIHQFICRSVIILDCKIDLNEHINIVKLSMYDSIITNSNKTRLKLDSIFPNKINRLFLPTIDTSRDIPKDELILKYKLDDSDIVVIYIDMSDESMISNIPKVVEKLPQYNFVIISNNHLQNKRIKFKIPDDFNLGEDLEVNINDEVVKIKTSKDVYKCGEQYYYFYNDNLVSNFIKKHNLSRVLPYDGDDYALINHSKYVVDLSKNIFKYHNLLKCGLLNKPCFAINYLDNDFYLRKGELIKTKIVNIGKENDIIVYDEDHLIDLISNDKVTNFDNNLYDTYCGLDGLEKTISNILETYYRNTYVELPESLKTNFKDIDSEDEKELTSIKFYNPKDIYFLGEIDNLLSLYTLCGYNLVQNIIFLTHTNTQKIDILRDSILKYKNTSNILVEKIEDYKDILGKINTGCNNILLVVSNNSKDEVINTIVDRLKTNHIIAELPSNNQTYTNYRLIYQDKGNNLENYSNINVSKCNIIVNIDKTTRPLKITDNKDTSLDINFFYGISAGDFKGLKNWSQTMIHDNHLSLKNELGDLGEFIRFFRHRTLWERLYSEDFTSCLIMEANYDKDKSEKEEGDDSTKDNNDIPNINIEKYIIECPDIDIIFYNYPFCMSKYIITKSGLQKILKNTKPLTYPIEKNIKQICIAKNLFFHCVSNSEDIAKLKLDIVQEKIEKRIIPRIPVLSYFRYIYEYCSRYINNYIESVKQRVFVYFIRSMTQK